MMPCLKIEDHAKLRNEYSTSIHMFKDKIVNLKTSRHKSSIKRDVSGGNWEKGQDQNFPKKCIPKQSAASCYELLIPVNFFTTKLIEEKDSLSNFVHKLKCKPLHFQTMICTPDNMITNFSCDNNCC
jgi:hypothetical protein